MTLDELHDMWAKDSRIDQLKLVDESVGTPILHAKYLRHFSHAKSKLVALEMKQKTLLKDKWLYYNGKMTQEQMDERGWDYDPFDGLKVLKGDMAHWYDSDPDIQESEMRIQYQKEIINTLKEIVDSLKWRHQTIKNIITWRQFEAGN